MVSLTLYIVLLLLYFVVMFNITSATSGVSPPYVPADNILLDCGALSKTTSNDKRKWDTDSVLKYSPSPDNLNASAKPAASVEAVPYSTARIFRSKFTYTIPVSKAGQIFLRLYFYPTNYSNGLDMTKSFFSVHAPPYILLSNFSASLNHQDNLLTLIKEYIVTVNQSRLLEVTFVRFQTHLLEEWNYTCETKKLQLITYKHKTSEKSKTVE